MQIGIDRGDGERTVLHIQSARKGDTFRALDLQRALRDMGRVSDIDQCLKWVRGGGDVVLEELPFVDSPTTFSFSEPIDDSFAEMMSSFIALNRFEQRMQGLNEPRKKRKTKDRSKVKAARKQNRERRK